MTTLCERIEEYKKEVAEVPDFPKPGVKFKDISRIVERRLSDIAADLAELASGAEFDLLAGIESRGFVFAAAMAARMGKPGVVLVRKKGKLPPPVESITYDSEYSTETLEVKRCADPASNRVVLVDDCAALGNTFRAAKELLEKAGYEVVDQIAVFRLSYLPGDKSAVKSLWEY